ncbi:MAG: hypothetical protein AABW73_00790 [Nanoarchaeota archaeon]
MSRALEFFRRIDLKSLANAAGQVVVPGYSTAHYVYFDRYAANPQTDGKVYVFEQRAKRFGLDLVKGLAWYGLYEIVK